MKKFKEYVESVSQLEIWLNKLDQMVNSEMTRLNEDDRETIVIHFILPKLQKSAKNGNIPPRELIDTFCQKEGLQTIWINRQSYRSTASQLKSVGFPEEELYKIASEQANGKRFESLYFTTIFPVIVKNGNARIYGSFKVE